MPLNSQLGVKDEVTYGTAVVVDRFYEFNSESIQADNRRITGGGLRSSGRAPRTDRNTPYSGGASGSLELEVLTNGFGWWLKHMLGASATGAQGGDGEYAHTGTVATLTGDSFTAQVNRPVTAGTDQAVTYEGGKITSWTISCAAEGLLMASFDCDFEAEETGTALASPSYPSGQESMTFVGGTVTIDSTEVPLTNFEVTCDNALNVDRRKLRGDSDKQEPLEVGDRAISWSAEADFTDLTQYNRTAAAVAATNFVEVEATFEGPTVIGGTTYPSLVITLPGARFDQPLPTVSDKAELKQSLGGPVHWDGSNELITVVYTSDDATA